MVVVEERIWGSHWGIYSKKSNWFVPKSSPSEQWEPSATHGGVISCLTRQWSLVPDLCTPPTPHHPIAQFTTACYSITSWLWYSSQVILCSINQYSTVCTRTSAIVRHASENLFRRPALILKMLCLSSEENFNLHNIILQICIYQRIYHQKNCILGFSTLQNRM